MLSNTLSSDQILKITNVGDIFTNNKLTIKSQYHSLCKIWHPDVNTSTDAQEVMNQIKLLYEKALQLMKLNRWEETNFVSVTGKNKKIYEFKYYVKYPFELGVMYINDNYVVYLIDEKHKDFYTNAINQIKNLKFFNNNMKQEISKYIPTILEKFETIDNQFGMIIKKTPDVLLLQDVLNYYNNIIDNKHVAWIMSSLYNIACYLDYNNISHNGITLSNCFISPEFHSVCLLGGWWYTKEQDVKMIGVPKDIFNILPPKTKEFKLSSITTDLESIRLLGKKMLGDDKNIPKPFVNWLKIGSSQKAKEEYNKWFNILNDSYGKRKFIIMNLKRNDLYK